MGPERDGAHETKGRSGRRLRAFLLCLVAAISCELTTVTPPGVDGGPAAGAGGGDNVDLDGSSSSGAGSGGQSLDPLCGEGSCNPDDPKACPDDGGSGAEGGGGGATGGAGATGGQGGGLGGTGGTGGLAGQAGAAGANAEGESPQGCGVERVDADDGVRRKCQPAGEGATTTPCFSSADCRPGLACVSENDGDASVCHPYCCAGSEVCDAGTYCTPRTLTLKATGPRGPDVPVCVPVDGCSLDDAFPCGDDQSCICQGKEACFVAREDGSTACWVPGDQQVGEDCGPRDRNRCAFGLVCSEATGTCFALCKIVEDGVGPDSGRFVCQNGKCQSASTLPDGFGICVGGERPDASLR